MVVERLSVVALPYSRAADADFHVSLFISPDLTPDGAVGKLSQFEHFRKWAAVLRDNATIELFDEHSPIPAKPLRDPLDPELWEAVFPPGTPVRGRTPLDWSKRRWRTFRAAELHDAAKVLHAAAVFASPVSPPPASRHPLREVIFRLGVKFRGGRTYDESDITRQLDQMIGENLRKGAKPPSLAELESMVNDTEPLRRFALQLHRARRFYERPEALEEYKDRPIEGHNRPRPDKPDPDFHERCTLVSDHPSLQRRLGLVLDLRVDDPSRLDASSWLSARIVPRGDTSACRLTRTRCAAVGDDLVTVPTGDDWDRGRLRLGDRQRFALLDVDPDGAALKLDRYLWSFPRFALAESNDEPVHAAPPALRSVGFTVVRNEKALDTQDKLARQVALHATANNPAPPLLSTEDVNQGLRVEVWDDEAKAWFSLHERRITAAVADHGVVASDLPEEGFIQGTTTTETPDVDDSPVHVHESVFGWEGWSLSAPRPGKRVRHEDGNEIVEDPASNPEPVTPLVVTNAVEPGTLPRLRYGRSYAFRAWGVDLAGNSRPHLIGTVPPPSSATVSAVSSVLESIGARHAVAAPLESRLRGETEAVVAQSGPKPEPPTVNVEAAEGVLAPQAESEREVLRRLRRVRGARPRTARVAADRASLVERAFGASLAENAEPLVASTAVVEANSVGRLVAAPAVISPGVISGLVTTVTPLKPFLRWDPVQPPTVVARHPLSAGESLRQVVIRSGVTQDMETLEITVTPPDAYAAGVPAELRYRATGERHLAPPKTSQTEAELHGAFDGAIGTSDANLHRQALAVALREAGSFFDVDVPRLDDPSVRDPQPGIALAHDPEVPPSTMKALPLSTGEAPAPGQYIVHDTDQLVLPYLPDVLARGISLVFPEAGRDRHIPFPFGTEGFTARYPGSWPERLPFRLVLHGSDELTGALAGTTLGIGLPPGDIQRFRLASSLDRAELDLFGIWRSLPKAIRDNHDVAEAAADGWLWALTPFDDITLVHAVPRPLEAPRPTQLFALRPATDATEAHIVGAVDVHGPSTDSLTLEAHWIDPIDDLSMPAPHTLTQQGVAFTTKIRPEEDLAVLGAMAGQTEDTLVKIPSVGPVWIHLPVHQLGDTKHRTISYRFRAATRFPEYFDPQTLAPADNGNDLPVDDGQSVVGPEVVVSVPSSALPAPPIVHSVLPLFRWESGTEPEQPVAVRRRRRAGVRLYLERPWFSSGEDELLGVLLAPGGDDTNHHTVVSQWGADPVWLSAPVERRAMFLELDNLLRVTGLDDDPGDALPVVPPGTHRLAADSQNRSVTVLGYRPQFSADRNMWYVDVAIEPGDSFWPFVRLAVARYQPDSIAGCHLSKHVRCDFVQLTPERTTSVSRTDVRHVRVVMSGPVGLRTVPGRRGLGFLRQPPTFEELVDAVATNRTVVARLQRRDPEIPTDLGWENVSAVELVIRGFGETAWEAAWVGELTAPEDIPLQRPGDQPGWRVVVEEWERLAGDPADLGFIGIVPPPPVWEQRLIYADEITL